MDLLTCLTHVSLVLRLPCEIHLFRSPSNVPGLPTFLKLLQDPHVLLTFGKVQNPLHLPHKNTASTSKNCPNMWCFRHFDFEMCPAPQRHALFQRLNFQKCSDTGMFSTFRLRNVLRATTAYTFSTSHLPKVLRAWCALYMLTSKRPSRHKGVHLFNISTSKSVPRTVCFVHFDFEVCASRHNRVQLFISHPARWLRTRRFSEPTFRPSGATNHWKNTVFQDFSTFSHTCIFFLLTLSLL